MGDIYEQAAEALAGAHGEESVIWSCKPWGNGSNMPGCTNVVCEAWGVVIADDVPEKIAALITLAPAMAEELARVKEALERERERCDERVRTAVARMAGWEIDDARFTTSNGDDT